MGLKLKTASNGSVSLEPTNTTSDYTLTVPAQTGTVVATDASGNVGIGTSSPDTKLNVVSADNTQSTDIIRVSSNNELVSLGIGYDTIRCSTLRFETGSSPTERMRIDSSGNVGIGTSNPNSGKLHIIAGTASTSNSLFIANQDGTINPYLQFQQSTSGTKIVAGNSYSGANNNIMFGTSNISETMRINGDGNLLVGTTSQYNDARVSVLSAGSGISFQNATNSYNACIFRNTSGNAVGTIVAGASSTAYNTSSDYRLKENIAPMTGALATVAQLKPCTYTWKSTGETSQGFIAHELQAVVPDCVTGEKDAVETYIDEDGNEQTRPVYQGIDTSFLVATLTAAIQELKAVVDAQAERITALENK